MEWSLILGSSGLAGIAYLIFKMGQFTQEFESFAKEVNKKFEYIDKQFETVKSEQKEIKDYLVSIDIRLSVLEAEQILYNAIPDSNARSEAAKERWRRKKELERKQLISKEG